MKGIKVKMSNRPINKDKSPNPLARLTYRQLQRMAFKLNLPANVKHKLLLALIIARTTKREDIVDAIVNNIDSTKKRDNLKEFKTLEVEQKYQQLEPIISSGFEVNLSQSSTTSMASTVTCWSEESGFSEIENCFITAPLMENPQPSVEIETLLNTSGSENTQDAFADILQYCSF